MGKSGFKGEQVAQHSFGDVRIVGIRWHGEDDIDMSFDLAFPDRKGVLTCFRATDFKIELDQTGYIGVIPAWDCEIKPIEKPGWIVTFDLSPIGSVTLKCNDLHLDVRNT
jgi:hypothetical protein